MPPSGPCGFYKQTFMHCASMIIHISAHYSIWHLAADWHPIRGWVGVFEWKCKEIHSATSYLPSADIHWKVPTSSPCSYRSCWKDVDIWSQAEDYRWVFSLNGLLIHIHININNMMNGIDHAPGYLIDAHVSSPHTGEFN